MSDSITGIVQEVNNIGLGKGSNIVINGQKYGAYDPVKAGIDQVRVGDEVSLNYAQKGQYTNILGQITKTGVTGTPQPVTFTGNLNSKGSPKGAWSKGVFPIPKTDGQRSIIRQNSVTNAVKMVSECSFHQPTPEDTAKLVIEIAQIFEDYSAGDIDERLANEAVAKLTNPTPDPAA
jgi:hypothetical protein